MITDTIPILRRTLMSGFMIAAFTLMTSGCMALTPSATTHSRDSNASAVKTAAAKNVASPSLPAGAELPPNWPWRGVNLLLAAHNSAKPADIAKLVTQFDLNSVHLYLHLKRFGQRSGLSDAQAWSQAMQWLDAMLAECKKYHLMAVVHLESFPKPGGGYYNQHKASFWKNPAAVNGIYTEVAALATHVHGYGYSLVAYDIISEPVMETPSGAVSPPGWDDIQNRIVQTIRADDPGSWVVVKPGPWGGAVGFSDFSPPPFPKLVYGVHMYVPGGYTNQGVRGKPLGVSYPGKIGRKYWDKQTLEDYLSPLIKFQDRYHALVYVGEFSVVRWAPNSDRYLSDLIGIFDAHGWGWSYHAVGGWNGWNAYYNASYAPTQKAAQVDKVGEKSQRWQTLKTLFKESQNGGG